MQDLKNTAAENFGGPATKLAPKEHQFSLEEVPSLAGKVALVTGGSEGIGYGCTHTLISHGISKLFCISLSRDVVENAKAAISEEIGADAAEKFVWLQCDLSDWAKTKETAEKIKSHTDRLDIVINNAARGIMTHQLAPSNGVDLHMASNHMGHVVLTSHLLPLLKKTADAGHTVRVVNLASNAHQNAPAETKFLNLAELNKDYGATTQYGRTKLANILYTRYLARHLSSSHPKILVNATHPGIVETAQTRKHILEPYPLAGYGLKYLLNPAKKDIFEGCMSTMFASTKTEKSGEYITPPAIPEQGSDMSRDEGLGEQLMRLTRELVADKTAELSREQGCPFRDF
ncbi:NAD(P)-binding protein [Viridothelium virens]|uniref:NAD(P)-binding protein n=1 Tax=Viridothelium virens TaxID=1048519 RepID=A0A6A6HJZ2_VIRVR|nr:NAD(P)-binding protein [Viridothelium virens]